MIQVLCGNHNHLTSQKVMASTKLYEMPPSPPHRDDILRISLVFLLCGLVKTLPHGFHNLADAFEVGIWLLLLYGCLSLLNKIIMDTVVHILAEWYINLEKECIRREWIVGRLNSLIRGLVTQGRSVEPCRNHPPLRFQV